MRVTVAIGQPAFVDCFVVARNRAHHFAAVDMQVQVRAQRIVVTERVASDQFPGAGAIAEDLVGQRADRADVDHVAGQFGSQRLAVIGADLQVLATAHAAELERTRDVGREADAARALDAAGHVGGDQRAQVFVGDHALAIDITRDRPAVTYRHVLEFALTPLVADRAVQRVVHQQEFHHVALRIERAPRLGVDLHAFHHRRGAGRRGLRHLFDVHQAHAAVGGDRQFFVVAETRDRDACLVGGMDDHRTLRRSQCNAVDLDVHHVGGGLGRCGAHAACSVLGCAAGSSTRKRLLTMANSNSFQ